jgi:anaerobic ribonucleoside-triphosphate reductase activating protein
MKSAINVAQVAANMQVLGYGRRLGVWTQGCHIGCPGCVSPHTHEPRSGRAVKPAQLLDWLLKTNCAVDGLTISGGEPTEQADAVLELIAAFRSQFPACDVLLYSGLTWRRLRSRHSQLVEVCDVVVAGPYVQHLPPRALRGSSNQTVHLLTAFARERYADFERWPVHTQQVNISSERITTVGIPNVKALADKFANNNFVDSDSASWRQ